MRISILTLFPEMFTGPFGYSIVKRAQEKGNVKIHFVNIRDFAVDKYKSVDDHPYGGGAGMILRVDVVDRALHNAKCQTRLPAPKRSDGGQVLNAKCKTILLDPQGIPYAQAKAQELSHLDHLILVCGHYEGVDERIRTLVDEEISIGDYVTTGGEIPAMVVVDSVVRLLPGVLKKSEATEMESFSFRYPTSDIRYPILEYPQYTRPPVYKGKKVPDILLSGNHQDIDAWRQQSAMVRTKKRRPDLKLTRSRH